MSLFVRPAAAADLDEAFRWYEARRPGLGGEFLSAVEQVFHAVQENPHRCQFVYCDLRRAHVRRFPYGIFYRLVGDDVVVVGCFHGRRNPRRWKGRR